MILPTCVAASAQLLATSTANASTHRTARGVDPFTILARPRVSTRYGVVHCVDGAMAAKVRQALGGNVY